MPIHKPLRPGKILRKIIIDSAGLSVTDAAKMLGVDRTTLSRLLNGHSGISADMALRLSKLLPNTNIQVWMNLQRDYDIWEIQQQSKNIHVNPHNSAQT